MKSDDEYATPQTSAPSKKLQVLPILCLLLLLAFHCVANLIWLRLDNHPVTHDEAMHIAFARGYYGAISAFPNCASVWEWMRGLRDISTAYPPMMHILGAGVIAFAGHQPDAVAITNTLVFLAAIVGVFALGTTLYEAWTGLWAALVFSFTPIAFGMSRYFLVDLGMATFTLWAFVALVKSDYLRKIQWAMFASVFISMGLLIKPFILFCTAPFGLFLAFVGAYRSLYGERREGLTSVRLWTIASSLVFVLVVPFLVFAPWQIAHIQEVEGLSNWAKEHGTVASSLGPAELLLRAERMGVELISMGMFLPLFILSMIGGVLSFIVRFRERATWFLGLAIAFYAAGSIAFATSPDGRMSLAILPMLAVYCALALRMLRPILIQTAAIVVVVALLGIQFTILSFTPSLHTWEIILPIAKDIVQYDYSRHGLVVAAGETRTPAGSFSAYSSGPNFIDTAFDTMVQQELQRSVVPNRRARFSVVGFGGCGFEIAQDRYWPWEFPLQAKGLRAAEAVFPLRPLTEIVARKDIRLALVHGDTVTPSETAILFNDPTQPGAEALGMQEANPVLQLDFPAPVELDALTVYFADSEFAATGVSIEFLDAATQTYRVAAEPYANPYRQRFMYCRFARISTQRIRVHLASQTDRGPAAIAVQDLRLYQNLRTPRPLLQDGNLPPGAVPQDLGAKAQTSEYIVLRTSPDEAALRKDWYDAYAQRFAVIREFDAPPYGTFSTQRISVMARRNPPRINFETNPMMRVVVTEDAFPTGRWDNPFWPRMVEDALPPSNKPFWCAHLNAQMLIDLSAEYLVSAVLLLPYSTEYGLQAADVEYLETATRVWRPLSHTYGKPVATEGLLQMPETKLPEPLRVRQIRISLRQGGTVKGDQFACLAQVVLEGIPATGSAP